MKKVICISKKNHNLTVEKKYKIYGKVLKQYLIINDNNIPCLYKTKLFKNLDQDDLEKELLSSIKDDKNYYDCKMHYDDISIKIETGLDYETSRISCNILEIANINIFFENLEYNLSNYSLLFRKNVFELIIKRIIKDTTCGIIMLSTNTDDKGNIDVNEYYPFINDILSPLCFDVIDNINNNSYNEVRLWIIKKH
jgi:hypothetical protein